MKQLSLAYGPGAVLLQSSRFDEENYRSFLFCQPEKLLSATRSDEVPEAFSQAERALAEGKYVAGFVSYECGEYFAETGLDVSAADVPLLWFGVYSRAYVFNHRDGCFDSPPHPVCPKAGQTRAGHHAAAPARSDPAFSIEKNLRPAISESDYARKIDAIREYIRAGDTYQINFTDKISFDFAGSPLAMFSSLQEQQRASYSAYLNLGSTQILSFSPELFFRVDHGRIVTRPMKGTAPRGRNAAEDAARAEWLRRDAKNRAENVMIVDLLRNDLGRICEFGSVRVDRLFDIEKYETLFQMTSTISGRLRPRMRYHDIFRSIFPCGSITGAPKIRSMQLIRELEQGARGIYTGAIGFLSPSGEAEFNVAIRTVVLESGRGHMGVGGGITYDSTAQDEYRECLLKAKFLSRSAPAKFKVPAQPEQPTSAKSGQICGTFGRALSRACAKDSSQTCGIESGLSGRIGKFQLIESILWNGSYPLLPLHLDRLEASAAHFGFVFDRALIRGHLERNRQRLQGGLRYKVRLLLNESGAVKIENSVLEESAKTCKVALSAIRTSSGDQLLRHKTTRRELYNAMFAEARRGGFDDVLFMNERGEITEGAISNVFVKAGGRLYTPPAANGLLQGVYRRHILETTSSVIEKTLLLSDLRLADALYICNAVRGMRRVELDDSMRLQSGQGSH